MMSEVLLEMEVFNLVKGVNCVMSHVLQGNRNRVSVMCHADARVAVEYHVTDLVLDTIKISTRWGLSHDCEKRLSLPLLN